MDLGAFDLDQRVRLAAFEFLARQSQFASDGVLPLAVLATGFTFDGIHVSLIGPQGLFEAATPPEISPSVSCDRGQAARCNDRVRGDGTIS